MINRNNYEEYLLMYIDGELSSFEMKSVDAFLEANPDLKEEMELLKQTILQPEEEITFSGKDMLYRKEKGITLSNYQEYFLLYVDEELTSTEREAVETFVLQNPALQEEFTLLKQTVLPKENIIFNNKEVLYRKEEKRRPVVISMRWASLAAAVMIGIIALVWIMNGGEKVDPKAGFATTNNEQKPTTPTTTQPEQTIIAPGAEAPLAVEEKNRIQKQVLQVNQHQPNQKASNEELVTTPQQRTVTPVVIEPELIASNIPANNSSLNSGSVTSFSDNDRNSKVVAVNTPEVNNNYVQQAVYTEELDTENDKNKNLYVGSLEINTDKVRGFFRKAGRLLKRNTGEDGDKIKVANIEVNKLK